MMTNIFQKFFNYDTLLHTISGFLLAYLGLKIMIKLDKKIINKRIISIFVLCFSMFLAVAWEFLEFTNDFFFLSDMQKDRIINNFSSVELKRVKPNSINSINHTIIYDQDNNVIIQMNGYLDVGLIDTMKDLFVNLLGALTFTIIFYFKGFNCRRHLNRIRF